MGAEAGAAAGAVTPGLPNLPATMDNFDAIIGSYDNQPEAPAPTAKPAKLSTPALGDELPDGGLEADGGDELADDLGDEDAEPQIPPDVEQLAAQAKEWAERPDLPDEFLQKKIVAKVNGQDIEITVEEAKNAFQRRAVTTQAQQEAGRTKQYYDNLIHGVRQQQQAWTRDPNQLENDLEDMELGPHLDHIVKQRFRKFADEQAVLDSIADPKHRATAKQRFENERTQSMRARAQAREAAQHKFMAEQNQGQTTHQQQVERTRNQMAQLGPRALREAGFAKDSPYIRKLLGKEVGALHKWGTDLTYEQVLEAAKNAKDIHDEAQETAVTTDAERRARSKAIPPRRAAAGSSGAKAAKPPASRQQARVSDFDKTMKDWDGGR